MSNIKRVISLVLAVGLLACACVTGVAATESELPFVNELTFSYYTDSGGWTGPEYGGSDHNPVLHFDQSIPKVLFLVSGTRTERVVYEMDGTSIENGPSWNPDTGGPEFLVVDLQDLPVGGSKTFTITVSAEGKRSIVYNVTVIKGNGQEPPITPPTPPTQTVAPSISVDGTPVVGNTVQVSMSSATPDADIHYTLDGSVPTTASTQYILPLGLSSIEPTSITVKAIAVKSDLTDSSVTTRVITFRDPSQPTKPDNGGSTPPSENDANTPATIDKLKDTMTAINKLDKITTDKLPNGVILSKTNNGKSIAVVPIKMTSGNATVSMELFKTLGSGSKNVGVEFTVSSGIAAPSVKILLPGGFGKITEDGRIYYPMNYSATAPDADAMCKAVKSKDALSTTAQVGGNFTLPTEATLTVKVKLPEGEKINIIRYDAVSKKYSNIGKAVVTNGTISFATRDFGQFLFTNGTV